MACAKPQGQVSCGKKSGLALQVEAGGSTNSKAELYDISLQVLQKQQELQDCEARLKQ